MEWIDAAIKMKTDLHALSRDCELDEGCAAELEAGGVVALVAEVDGCCCWDDDDDEDGAAVVAEEEGCVVVEVPPPGFGEGLPDEDWSMDASLRLWLEEAGGAVVVLGEGVDDDWLSELVAAAERDV
jgi:hypothetical protein